MSIMNIVHEDEFPYYVEKLKIRPVCIINGKRYEFGESNYKKEIFKFTW